MNPELIITIPKPLWMTSNMRLHRMAEQAKVHTLRALGAAAARASDLPHMNQIHIGIAVGYPTRVKADPPNAWPTIKPCIDGIVDSGVLAEDDSEVVWCHSFMRATAKSPRGVHTLRLIFTDQRLPWMEDI